MSQELSIFEEKKARAQQLLVDCGSKLMQVFPALAHSLWVLGDWKNDFDTFYEFVQADFPKGLSLRWKQFMVLCKDDHDCREMIIRETPAIEDLGANDRDGYDNIIPNDQGTSPVYILGRLHRDARSDNSKQEIIEKLAQGTIKTITEAGVIAGYRSPYISVKKTPEGFAKKIAQIFTEDEWQNIINSVDKIKGLK